MFNKRNKHLWSKTKLVRLGNGGHRSETPSSFELEANWQKVNSFLVSLDFFSLLCLGLLPPTPISLLEPLHPRFTHLRITSVECFQLIWIDNRSQLDLVLQAVL